MSSTTASQNRNEVHTQPPGASPSPATVRTDGPAKGTAGVHPSAIGPEGQESHGARSDQDVRKKESKSLTQSNTAPSTESLGQNRREDQPRQQNNGSDAKDTNSDHQDGEDEKPSTAPDGGYPPQLHAGRLDGVGPEYGSVNRITLGERFQGVKEQVKGAIKKDPELKQKGHDRMTGELKKKEKEKEENASPFNTAGGDDPTKSNSQKDNNDSQSDSKPESQPQADQQPRTPSARQEKEQPERAAADKIQAQEPTQREAGTDAVPKAHPNDSMAYEQAKTVSGNEAKQGQDPVGKETVEAGVPTDRRTRQEGVSGMDVDRQ